jgi:protein TonB
MTLSNFEKFEAEQTNLLLKSAALALVILFMVAVVAFYISQTHFKVTSKAQTELPVLEAELIPPETPAHLREPQPISHPKAAHEVTVSKVLSKTQASTNEMKKVMESANQTLPAAPPEAASHGPVVESAPAPRLPEYLKEQNLKTSLLIEFVISATGEAHANLLGTSGNEELDALAIKTAQSWRFRPAKKDGKAIDSKVRLRINFEVN